MKIPPKKILLATDLSARSDRAHDRAVMLMKQYNCELLVLYAIEPPREHQTGYRSRFSRTFNPDEKLIELARRQMRETLPASEEGVTIKIVKGKPAEIILTSAEEEKCDLIVCGVARNDVFGRNSLGKTVDILMQKSGVPLLIVTARSGSKYSKIVIATDFSEISGLAIKTAVSFFPKTQLDVLYAHDAPGSYAAEDQGAYREQMRLVAHKEFLLFLDSLGLTAEERRYIGIIIEWGKPAVLLNEYAQLSAADLVVLGSNPRGRLKNFFFDSYAGRIVSNLKCDALVIRGSAVHNRTELITNLMSEPDEKNRTIQ